MSSQWYSLVEGKSVQADNHKAVAGLTSNTHANMKYIHTNDLKAVTERSTMMGLDSLILKDLWCSGTVRTLRHTVSTALAISVKILLV